MTSLVEREARGGGVGDGRGWVEKGWQAAVQGGGLAVGDEVSRMTVC